MKSLLYAWWRRTPATIRKPLIFILGFCVVILGIILLPLPGPGWVVIFIGFAILASEFTFAERVRDLLVSVLKWLADFGLKLLKESWNNPFQA